MKELKLGRGLSDLLQENDLNISTDELVRDININEIKPNPDQPRIVFDEATLQDLADSIKEHGVIQPIIVKPGIEGYILVAGERRLKASERLGLKTIPTIVREYNSIYLAELALLENLQREDLTAIEEAIAIQKLQINLQITHEELGKKIGKSRTYITNLLGLLKLPQSIIDDVNKGVITPGHARALSKLKTPEEMIAFRNRTVNEELSVRELEAILRDYSNKTKITVSKKTIKASKQELNEFFEEKLNINVSNNKVSFKFKNEAELKEIVRMLKGMRD